MSVNWNPSSVWDKHKDYPRSDWQHEVRDDNTVLGYHDWVRHQLESAAGDSSPTSKTSPSEPPLGHGRVPERSLDDQRRDEIEHIYSNGDWADDHDVEANDGWETVQPGDAYWCTVYVRDPDNLAGPTVRMVLTITFQKETADVESIETSDFSTRAWRNGRALWLRRE